MDEERAWEFALSFPNDLTHGEDHVRRVVSRCLKLAKHYPGADVRALTFAAILHDCGRAEEINDPKVPHAKAGAEKAERFLLENGETRAFASRVGAIIAAHSRRSDAQMGGIEERLLFDADKLDMCGAVGIYRGIAYCAANGLPLTGKGGAVETVEWDMEHVKRSLFTPEAGEMAKDGLEFMRAFALRLRAETENIREV
ncbi:MAG: HD domain-containing protein [Clostridia bacterium]|nr:HD domain-containing protein [Clostridia bacterium]MCR4576519.1 HD domain-containing protein [Clostridiales bacterium]